MQSLLGAVADDFTGACDVGIQFRKHGLKTAALIVNEGLPSKAADFDMVVFDTETRNLTPEEAYTAVKRALNALEKLGMQIVYKKIDSTLRGNIGTELDAVLDVLDANAVLVAPAFPEQGRTVVNGQLLVNNIPVAETEFAFDPLKPVRESHIPSLIGQQTNRKVNCIDLFKVRKGTASLLAEIQKLIGKGAQIIVADAETKGDLANIAGALANTKILPCGSAGLAGSVASLLSNESRVLVVTGSVNEVTLRQIVYAQKELGMTVLEPVFSEALADEKGVETAATALAKKACEALIGGKDVVVRLAESREALLRMQEKGERLGIARSVVSSRLLSVLGRTVKKILESQRLGGLIVVGGDSLIEVMKAVNAEGITVEDEVLPGIPTGKILGGKHEGMKVATKAGGFGDEHSLVELVKLFRSLPVS